MVKPYVVLVHIFSNLELMLDAGNWSLASGYGSLVTCLWLLELVGTEAGPAYTKWFKV